MKHQFLLFAILAVAFSSCTTAYRSGQTPDDVYFSPARPQDEYVRVEEKDENYRYDDDYYDDRYLRMKVHNYSRWDNLNDWYTYDRYGSRYNFYYGADWNPYTSWNYYYNPYFSKNINWVYTKVPANPVNYTKSRNFNVSSYTNRNFNNTNSPVKSISNYNYKSNTRPVYNNSNSSGLGNSIKQIFSNNNYNSNGGNSRDYSPLSSGSSSGSSSSSSSSSGSSGGGVSRPSRGGN